uniref:Uncharacterized protein n=1 Tax=Anguilla anguilla TaxID=7936 RepID=A0A0E9VUJ6_ANGAN
MTFFHCCLLARETFLTPPSQTATLKLNAKSGRSTAPTTPRERPCASLLRRKMQNWTDWILRMKIRCCPWF